MVFSWFRERQEKRGFQLLLEWRGVLARIATLNEPARRCAMLNIARMWQRVQAEYPDLSSDGRRMFARVLRGKALFIGHGAIAYAFVVIGIKLEASARPGTHMAHVNESAAEFIAAALNELDEQTTSDAA